MHTPCQCSSGPTPTWLTSSSHEQSLHFLLLSPAASVLSHTLHSHSPASQQPTRCPHCLGWPGRPGRGWILQLGHLPSECGQDVWDGTGKWAGCVGWDRVWAGCVGWDREVGREVGRRECVCERGAPRKGLKESWKGKFKGVMRKETNLSTGTHTGCLNRVSLNRVSLTASHLDLAPMSQRTSALGQCATAFWRTASSVSRLPWFFSK